MNIRSFDLTSKIYGNAGTVILLHISYFMSMAYVLIWVNICACFRVHDCDMMCDSALVSIHLTPDQRQTYGWVLAQGLYD